MTTLYYDSDLSDAQRRQALYGGDVFVFSAKPSTAALTGWAETFLRDAFAPADPREAQHSLDVHDFVSIFAPVKPAFIHHPTTKELVREMMRDFGCDDEQTYLDVPRLRGVTSDGYLTAGVGYAHPLHRDTWWSAPLTQLNWWLPIYPFESSSSMAFHFHYFDAHVENTSDEFDYYNWNKVGRADAAKHVTSDTRKQPHITQPVTRDPEIRLVVPPGGVVLFSGAQMHSTVANVSGLTRFSIDVRTVNLDDVRARGGAPNMDSRPTGTSLRDFRRMRDNEAMPEEVVHLYDDREVDPEASVFVAKV